MPGFDQSGPRGEGPLTGGGRGRCNSPSTGYGYGRGRFGGTTFGRGMANRRGARGGRWSDGNMPGGYPNRFAGGAPVAAGAPADELNLLKAEADRLQDTLQGISSRITELEKLL